MNSDVCSYRAGRKLFSVKKSNRMVPEVIHKTVLNLIFCWAFTGFNQRPLCEMLWICLHMESVSRQWRWRGDKASHSIGRCVGWQSRIGCTSTNEINSLQTAEGCSGLWPGVQDPSNDQAVPTVSLEVLKAFCSLTSIVRDRKQIMIYLHVQESSGHLF